MRFIAAVLALFVAVPLFADAVEDVRQTETAFAKAFADRDKEKFFSFVSDDATFLGSGPARLQRGKAEIVASWSRFFEGPQAPFSWRPERVAVSADGTLALSNGPVFAPSGEEVGSYQSTWRKQADGNWKILFDGAGPAPERKRIEKK